VRQWGVALHNIRPKVGPQDKLYATVEWLVQEHGNLQRLITAALAVWCLKRAFRAP
jgi:hypothetical protein